MEQRNLTELFTQNLGKSIIQASAYAALDLFQMVSTGKIAEEEGKRRLEHYQKILPKLRELGSVLNCDVADTLECRLICKEGPDVHASQTLIKKVSQISPSNPLPLTPEAPAILEEPTYRSLADFLNDYTLSGSKITAAVYLRAEAQNNDVLNNHAIPKARGKQYQDIPEVKAAIAALLAKGGYLQGSTPQMKNNGNPPLPHKKQPVPPTPRPSGDSHTRIPYDIIKVAGRTGIPADFIVEHEDVLDVQTTEQGGGKTYDPLRLPYLTRLREGNMGKVHQKEQQTL